MDMINIGQCGGTPTLFINGEPHVCNMLMTVKNLNKGQDEWCEDPWAQQFSEAGIKFISTDNTIFNFDATYDAETDSFPEEKFEGLEQYKGYIKRIPGVKIFIRAFCEPRGEDSAWIKKYPEECELMERGVEAPYMTPSYASEVWLKDAERYFKALGEQIIKRGLADNILGFLVGCGDSTEWVKIGPMEDWAGDYSKPMQKAFGKWLKDKYVTVENLQSAWKNNKVNFESDDLIPSPERQSATDIYLFKEPELHRDAIDHYEFLGDLVAEDINRLCKAAKECTDNHHLAGVFYGYIQEMVWNNGFFGQGKPDADILHFAAARSGHGGLKTVLESKYVDFLCSPYSYGFRGIGGEGGFMSLTESVRRAGKLWISEEDTRTHRWLPDSGYGQARNKKELVEILKRQFSDILVHSTGAWWCDWASGWSSPNINIGSFDEPEVMDLFKRMVQLEKISLTEEDRTSAAEIAVVVDCESSYYRSTENSIEIPNWRGRAWGISRMGAPVDYVLLSDVLSGKVKKYKMYYMLNIFHLEDEKREQLKDIVQKDGIVTLWIYAPGYAGTNVLDSKNIEDITGMSIKCRTRRWSMNAFISDFDHEITKKLPTSTFFGTDMQIGPIFSINPTDDVRILGTMVSQQGRCEGGLAVKENKEYTTVYSTVPNIPPGILNGIARMAGVHLYTESEDVFYASKQYIMLHTVKGEKKKVSLPQKSNVYDAFTGELLASNCDMIEFNMCAGTTKLLYYGNKTI